MSDERGSRSPTREKRDERYHVPMTYVRPSGTWRLDLTFWLHDSRHDGVAWAEASPSEPGPFDDLAGGRCWKEVTWRRLPFEVGHVDAFFRPRQVSTSASGVVGLLLQAAALVERVVTAGSERRVKLAYGFEGIATLPQASEDGLSPSSMVDSWMSCIIITSSRPALLST